MNKVIDEWEQVFANDVNRLLLKCFMRFIQEKGLYGFCFGLSYLWSQISFNLWKNRLTFVIIILFGKFSAPASDNRQEYFLKVLSHATDQVDFKHVEVAHKIDSKTSIDDLIQFALINLSHEYHTVRVTCATIIKRMSKHLIQNDMDWLSKRQEKQTLDDSTDAVEWHSLHKFGSSLQ